MSNTKRETVVLIGCGAAKQAKAAPAGELYTGNLFRAAREWAIAHGDRWGILSAKHGLLMPDTVIEPYDARVPTADDDLRAWIFAVNAAIWGAFYPTGGDPAVRARLGWKPYTGPTEAPRLIVLAGADYLQAIDGPKHRRLVGQGEQLRPITAECPLAGLELGERLRWFKEQRGEPVRAPRPTTLQLGLGL